MRVDLTPSELSRSDRVADAWMREGDRGLNNTYSLPARYRAEWNRQGAAAEPAVARLLGLAWTEGADWRDYAGDVGDLEIRSTSRPRGSLIVHPSPGDSPSARFVLVVCARPSFRIAGWLWGREAQQARHWRDDVRTPAFFVLQRCLRPAVELIQAA